MAKAKRMEVEVGKTINRQNKITFLVINKLITLIQETKEMDKKEAPRRLHFQQHTLEETEKPPFVSWRGAFLLGTAIISIIPFYNIISHFAFYI